jgi:malate permease and related proteins
MDDNLRTVLVSIFEVFGLVAVAYLYARRVRFDAQPATRIGMDLLVPCLTFTAILDSRIAMDELPLIGAATVIQVGMGLLIGWAGLRLLGWQWRRELLLPIAFLNSANIFYPLLLANFGVEGLSRGLLINTTVNVLLFSVGIAILHGGGRFRDALRQPALWVTLLAVALRLLRVQPPDLVMRIPRLAGTAAVPLMLILFGHALAGARLRSLRAAAVGTILRYASGVAALGIILAVLDPQGLLRKVLVLYMLLPSAMINVLLTQRAGRDAEAVASTVVLTTLVALGLLPVLLLVVG